MFRIDGHCHTRFSPDSSARVGRIVSWAVGRGLAALAITDHDTMAGVDPVRREVDRVRAALEIVPGIEVTTDRRTHVIGLWISRPPRSRSLLDVIDEIHDLGGLVALPHPYRRDTGLLANAEDEHRHGPREVEAALSAIDLIELSNAKSDPAELDRLRVRLPDLPRVPLIAGSDAHAPHEVGRSVVEVDEPSPDGLRRGGVVVRLAAADVSRGDLGRPAGAMTSIRRRLTASIPAPARAPWRAIKREVREWLDARIELERSPANGERRWRRDPATGVVEPVTAATGGPSTGAQPRGVAA